MDRVVKHLQELNEEQRLVEARLGLLALETNMAQPKDSIKPADLRIFAILRLGVHA